LATHNEVLYNSAVFLLVTNFEVIFVSYFDEGAASGGGERVRGAGQA